MTSFKKITYYKNLKELCARCKKSFGNKKGYPWEEYMYELITGDSKDGDIVCKSCKKELRQKMFDDNKADYDSVTIK